MSKKTSFKQLLSKTGSDPTVSLQNVRAQREKLQQLKAPTGAIAPAAKAAREHARPAAAAPPSAPPPTSVSTSTTFMPAGMFAGKRPGYVFKAGPDGVGYYRDEMQPAPLEPADAAADDAEGEASTSALPSNFFDNPQNDPANRGKQVAKTQKAQTLNDEMADFNKLVEADLVAADAADEEADEDEEEAKLRDAVSVAREMEMKIAVLKRKRAEFADGATGAQPATEAAKAEADGSVVADGGGGDGGGGGGDDDDDDDGADLSGMLDWRSKGF